MNVYVRDLSRELARHGHHVDVFTRFQNPDVKQVNHGLGENARVIHIPAGPAQSLDKEVVLNYVPDFVSGVLSFAAQAGITYDVIHSHYWLSGWASRELRKAWRVPIVQMFHTLAHMKNSVAQSEAEKESQQRIDIEREIMAFSDRLVAATPMERAQMAWLYGADPEKISVVPCGVDTSLFVPQPRLAAKEQLGLPAQQPMILFVGRIEPLKGIDTLIRAISLVLHRAKLPAMDSSPTVLIVGGTPEDSPTANVQEVQRLHMLREELELTNRIVFLGSRPQEILPLYYSAADMVIVPSHYESFGMVALEAMACGTPVIASKVGGLSLSVQDGITGYLVPNGDPDKLADKIELLLGEPGLVEAIGNRAVEWARQFRWPLITRRILEIYDEVSAHKSASVYCGCR